MSNKVYTDRTRTVAYQRCHRLGWLTTYEGGRGIQRKTLSPHLLVGIAVHDGINRLFMGADVNDALDDMKGQWDQNVADKQIEECLSEYQQAMLRDCWNLVEGQVRAFELVMLPTILAEYEVLDTEKEECYELDAAADGYHPDANVVEANYPAIWWMARLDATLKHKATGDIGPLSIKTTGRWDKRKEDAARHDMQGCSEMWTLQQREDLKCEPFPASIQFVQMLYVLKGYKKENPVTGQWEFWSPLTKGYRRGDEYAHTYWWTCKEMHHNQGKRAERWCEGGKKHNCQGWEAVDIAGVYPGGIQQWVRDLQDLSIQPLAAETEGLLGQQFIFPPPIYRGQQEIDRWKRSTVFEKREIIKAAQVIETTFDAESRQVLLDQYFPMYTHSCDYPSKCAMQDICHGGVDPLESGLYEPRKANHPIEEDGI